MLAHFKSSYRKIGKDERPLTVFVYKVKGTETEIASFIKAQGEHYKPEADGSITWFTPRFNGKVVKLLISAKSGKVVADNTESDQVRSMLEQNDNALGRAIAELYAKQMLGKFKGPDEASDLVPA